MRLRASHTTAAASAEIHHSTVSRTLHETLRLSFSPQSMRDEFQPNAAFFRKPRRSGVGDPRRARESARWHKDRPISEATFLALGARKKSRQNLERMSTSGRYSRAS